MQETGNIHIEEVEGHRMKNLDWLSLKIIIFIKKS